MKFMANNYEKVNTFSRRIEISQIFTYCMIISQLIIFLAAVQTNYISSSYQIVMNCLILPSFCVMVVAGLKVSSIDPVDSVLLQYRNGDQQKVMGELGTCLYCDTCNSYVRSTSKHCKLCDRCVDRFDHHCTWINNCIGEENYIWFMAMIISALIYMLLFLVSVGLVYQEQNWNTFLPAMIISWIAFGLTLPFSLLLLILTSFHFNLIRTGMTTYEFIMLKRSEEEAKINSNNKNDVEQMNKTQQNIAPIRNKGEETQKKGIIFHQSVESSQSQTRKIASQKNNQLTTDKVSKTQLANSTQIKSTNEKEMKDFFNRHKSLKFLMGQSLVVHNNTTNSYHSHILRQANTQMQKEKAYRSLENKQLRRQRQGYK